MIGTLFRPGVSPLHRTAAGWKLAGLVVGGAVMAFLPGPWPAWTAALAATGLLLSTRVPARLLLRDLAWPLAAILVVFAVNTLVDGPAPAATAFARLLTLLSLAHAVAVTTPTAELLAAFEKALLPFHRMGLVDAGRASLAVSLAIRFIPVVAEEAGAIRRAQAARGLERNPVALAVPLVVRCLRRADALALALDARGWPASPAPARPSPSAIEGHPDAP